MKKRRIAFTSSGYNKKWLLYHPWDLFFHYRDEFKWFIQRGLYGYADCDWWSLDSYLSSWLPSALRKIKGGMGYPGRGRANTPRKWARILQEMIEGFEASYKMIDGVPSEKKYKKLQIKKRKGLALFFRWFDALWD